MCLGIAYEVASVDGENCLARVGSGLQPCFTGLVGELAPGDWVVVHAGFALEKIMPEDAQENMRLIARYILGEVGEEDGELRSEAL
jgi:hydrogenase expression/formation protein HypC